MRFFKYVLAGLAALAVTGVAVFAYAQMTPGSGMGDMGSMHQQMMQNMQGGQHGGGMGGNGAHSMGGAGNHGMGGGGMMGHGGGLAPMSPGQAAFGAIAEVVATLDADSSTDWSKVNIAALREHLIDMDEVTLRATAEQRSLDNGVEIFVTGAGRTLTAIKRMVPAHVSELAKTGWEARTDELPNGVKLTVTSKDASQAAKLKALGFIGIMVQGAHHQPHHLAMAKGDLSVH